MTANVCIDGVAISDAATRICVDGAAADLSVDGVVAYDQAPLAPLAPNITTSTALATQIQNGVAAIFTPTNTGGAVTSYAIVGGAIPPGMSLNTTTGVISGTPTTDGSYNFVLRATNATATSDFAHPNTTVITAPNITTSATLDSVNDNDGDITNGAAITAWTPTDTGGSAIFNTYTIVAGALPAGLSINALSGQISGTPTVDGVYTWTVRATNASGTSDFADGVTVNTAAAAAGTIAAQPFIFPILRVSNGQNLVLLLQSNGQLNFSGSSGTTSGIVNWNTLGPLAAVGAGWSIRAQNLGGTHTLVLDAGGEQDGIWYSLASNRNFIIDGSGIAVQAFGSSIDLEFSNDRGATVAPTRRVTFVAQPPST